MLSFAIVWGVLVAVLVVWLGFTMRDNDKAIEGAESEMTSEAPVIFTPELLGTVTSDISYCSIEGADLLMDVHWPTEGDGPFPVALYVHGGAWSSGDKAKGVDKYVDAFTQRGIVIASVNYRLADEYHFPAMIQDVKCAVRHIRTFASAYNIDPDRFGAVGG
ncbi:MAG: hypothetical protein UY72_C0063G0002, partial [Candidatus Uhrbacteria bacterium GW2011_GWD2_52_7]